MPWLTYMTQITGLTESKYHSDQIKHLHLTFQPIKYDHVRKSEILMIIVPFHKSKANAA